MNCIDLFAGAGGFSLAARNAGLTIKLAVEHNKKAASTYRKNFSFLEPKLVLRDEDIRTLSPDLLMREIFGEKLSCDLLLGGPPCQGFSTHRLNDAGVSDERNDLIHIYFDFVRAFSPTVFLMENVPGMLWPRHKAALDRFYSKGAESGYDVFEPVVLDARDYGIAQRRKRVFILGLRRGVQLGNLAWPLKQTHGSDVLRRTKPHLEPWAGCQSAFLPAAADDPNDIHMKHGEALLKAFANTPPNGGSRHASGRTLNCHSDHDGHNDVYGRIDPTKPAPTMTTACINPSKGRFVHPTLHHGITVRQAARIQTFPDDFVFDGGLIAAGEQVGNAVPVAFAQKLIEHIKPLLSEQKDGVKSRRDVRQRELA
ncbi:DNA cytosine methyltransferase [Mesorhizobium sp. M0854]|uniref:DNA cytosine methyltransferase n=1 Tax=Mesorhizobium sp. M0854 TaxID=2957013 RepID=UPI00333C4EAA